MKAAILDLFGHMHWADAAMWKAVLANPGASKDEDLRKRLRHIHLTQQAFFHVWRGQPFDYQSIQFSDLAGLMKYARDYHAEAADYLASVDEPAWQRPVVMPWADYFSQKWGREAAKPTFRETAFQLALHTTHHRGQVNSQLRQLGSEPPLVDYIIWLWLGRPAPDWPG